MVTLDERKTPYIGTYKKLAFHYSADTFVLMEISFYTTIFVLKGAIFAKPRKR
jgi:hypothetical protein